MLDWPINGRTNSQIEKLNLSALKPARNMQYSPNFNFPIYFSIIFKQYIKSKARRNVVVQRLKIKAIKAMNNIWADQKRKKYPPATMQGLKTQFLCSTFP